MPHHHCNHLRRLGSHDLIIIVSISAVTLLTAQIEDPTLTGRSRIGTRDSSTVIQINALVLQAKPQCAEPSLHTVSGWHRGWQRSNDHCKLAFPIFPPEVDPAFAKNGSALVYLSPNMSPETAHHKQRNICLLFVSQIGDLNRHGGSLEKGGKGADATTENGSKWKQRQLLASWRRRMWRSSQRVNFIKLMAII